MPEDERTPLELAKEIKSDWEGHIADFGDLSYTEAACRVAVALIEQSTPVVIVPGTECKCGQGFMAHNRCSFCPRCGKEIIWK